jgi:hexulose-6-phosphate isomerase
MNNIAFSCGVSEATAERLLADLAAAGFQGVEPTFLGAGALPVDADPRHSAEKLRKLADKAGLKIPSMRGGPGFWPAFAAADPQQRTQAVARAEAALEAVKIMGGDVLLIVPGRWDAGQTYTQTWNHALETAQRVARVAEQLSLTVALENVENRFLFSPREWMAFLDAIGSPQVRMYFDVGNVVNCLLGYPQEWIRELGARYIRRIHFKDARAGGPVLHLLEGDVDWPAVREAMEQMNYADWVGVELNLPKHHSEAMLAATCRSARAILAGDGG